MYNQENHVIYIGKAKNLKNRIRSYFVKTTKDFSPKTNALVAEIANIEITITQNEIEALLLENKLINQFKPKYNVIFRDDKSYPYVLITNEDFPSVRLYRGREKFKAKQGVLYGPYPNIKAVKLSLDLLYKVFKIRNCDPVTFKNRVRPCLEYQLNRCTAPCVGFIDKENYQQDLAKVKLFLQSRSKLLIRNLTQEMLQASTDQNYELAAKLRDQIQALELLQHEQAVFNKKLIDLDVLGIAMSSKLVCIHLLRIRSGDVLYSKQFFSKISLLNLDEDPQNYLSRFIMQNYMISDGITNNEIRAGSGVELAEILTSIALADPSMISDLIGIKTSHAKSGDRLAWQQMAQNSAEEALISRVTEYRQQKNNYQLLANLLGRSKPIERIACFDISHTYGKETVGSCVVFNVFGKEKSSFRLFNIQTQIPGDDYQALAIAITRYLEKVISHEALVPSLLIVDGGKGQLGIAEKILDDFKKQGKLINNISLLAICKGKDRIPGLEKFYVDSSGKEISLPNNNKIFKLLQKIRDTAHNFAIYGHRRKRDRVVK